MHNKIAVETMNSNTRKYWIDSLRALAIIFVVCLHASYGLPHWDKYNILIGPIMLPLFFAISGYVYSFKEGNHSKFYKNLFFKLIIPWFVLSLIWAKPFLIPFRGFSPYFTDRLYQFISGKTLWYLPCCAIAEIIQFYIRKLFKKHLFICIADLLLCIVGFTLAYFNICNFFNINKALIAQFYFMLGYILRNGENLLSRLKWKYVLSLIFCYFGLAGLSMFIFPGEYIDVNRNMYPNIPYYLVFISIGIFSLFITANKLNFKPNFLVYIGQNTLFIYAMHSFALALISKVLLLLNINLPNSWIIALVITAVSILLCEIGALVVNKFLPEIVGKRRKKQTAQKI